MVIVKALLLIMKADLQEDLGCLQMCGGQISSIKATVHGARKVFDSNDTDAVLLVDVTNAFNTLNHLVTLQNIRGLYPPFSTILINTKPLEFCLYKVIPYSPKRVQCREIHSSCPCMPLPPSPLSICHVKIGNMVSSSNKW